jgi:hypothetical protein
VQTAVEFPVARRDDEIAVTLTSQDGVATRPVVDAHAMPLRLGPGQWLKMDVVVTRKSG